MVRITGALAALAVVGVLFDRYLQMFGSSHHHRF